MRLELYEDLDSRLFHYQYRVIGQENSRDTPMLCGLPRKRMRKAQWFPVGDERGRVHFDRACEGCVDRLEI